MHQTSGPPATPRTFRAPLIAATPPSSCSPGNPLADRPTKLIAKKQPFNAPRKMRRLRGHEARSLNQLLKNQQSGVGPTTIKMDELTLQEKGNGQRAGEKQDTKKAPKFGKTMFDESSDGDGSEKESKDKDRAKRRTLRARTNYEKSLIQDTNEDESDSSGEEL